MFFGASNGTILANRPTGPKPGFGVLADGKEIRFAAVIDSDVRRFGTNASFPFNHEFSHTLGLPDLGSSATGWDPMAATEPAPGRPARTSSAGTSGSSAGSTRRS